MTDTTASVVETTAIDEYVHQKPVTAEAVEPEVSEAESSPAVTDTDESAEQPKKKGIQSRIDELTREKHEERRAREAAERRETQLLEMLQRNTPAKAEPVEAEKPLARPKLEDFNFDEAAYEAALDAYHEKKDDERVEAKFKAREEAQAAKARTDTWKTRENEFRAKTDDYESVAYYAPMSDAMAELITESDRGPELAYYLGKNKEIATQIAQLDPVRAARELGRLEAKLEIPAPVVVAKAISKAPPPPPKIDATESPIVDKDESKMSDHEWYRHAKRLQNLKQNQRKG